MHICAFKLWIICHWRRWTSFRVGTIMQVQKTQKTTTDLVCWLWYKTLRSALDWIGVDERLTPRREGIIEIALLCAENYGFSWTGDPRNGCDFSSFFSLSSAMRFMALDKGLSADSRPVVYPSLLDIKKIYPSQENKKVVRTKKWSLVKDNLLSFNWRRRGHVSLSRLQVGSTH